MTVSIDSLTPGWSRAMLRRLGQKVCGGIVRAIPRRLALGSVVSLGLLTAAPAWAQGSAVPVKHYQAASGEDLTTAKGVVEALEVGGR